MGNPLKKSANRKSREEMIDEILTCFDQATAKGQRALLKIVKQISAADERPAGSRPTAHRSGYRE